MLINHRDETTWHAAAGKAAVVTAAAVKVWAQVLFCGRTQHNKGVCRGRNDEVNKEERLCDHKKRWANEFLKKKCD